MQSQAKTQNPTVVAEKTVDITWTEPPLLGFGNTASHGSRYLQEVEEKEPWREEKATL